MDLFGAQLAGYMGGCVCVYTVMYVYGGAEGERIYLLSLVIAMIFLLYGFIISVPLCRKSVYVNVWGGHWAHLICLSYFSDYSFTLLSCPVSFKHTCFIHVGL